jgi:pyruvate formate lyase activating enzyme
MTTLSTTIDSLSGPAALVEALANGDVRCTACAHRCLIHPGQRGICQVRYNAAGTLRVPCGYTAALNVDPIEKKPFDHFLPGTDVLTFGMLGCNLHCDFCQNWFTSQALRDPACDMAGAYVQPITAKKLVSVAQQSGAAAIASSYNEPIITSEWAFEVFTLARAAGLHTAMVSNGYASPEALRYMAPVMDAYKIDLKAMRDASYRSLGGVLQHVLDSISLAVDLGLWVEVVTLVIPGFNDSPDELYNAAHFIAAVSPDIPWHVTGYHPDYMRPDGLPTSAHGLQQAAEIGQEAGLRYVYAGNLPGRVGSLEDTHCPSCNTRLIQRRGYHILSNVLTDVGQCPYCSAVIPGVWK